MSNTAEIERAVLQTRLYMGEELSDFTQSELNTLGINPVAHAYNLETHPYSW